MKNIVVNILDKPKIMEILNKLNPDTKPEWGNLTPLFMIEHLLSTIKYSNGKTKHKLCIPKEHIDKYRHALFEDKDFPRFYKSPVFEEDLKNFKSKTIQEAIDELYIEIEILEDHFKDRFDSKEMHPVFGELNYHEWIICHNKHFQHHFKQFNLIEK